MTPGAWKCLPGKKHCSLLDPFISKKDFEMLRIRPLKLHQMESNNFVSSSLIPTIKCWTRVGMVYNDKHVSLLLRSIIEGSKKTL
jgi:hypothetical protein